MTGFVQIIEFKTSRYDEIRALVDERRDRPGLALGGMIAEDRDQPGTYINVVEFESYETAMENSNSPETQEFAARMAELCDGPAKFTNLNLLEKFHN
jgi:quinol monooxygenase YgiN